MRVCAKPNQTQTQNAQTANERREKRGDVMQKVHIWKMRAICGDDVRAEPMLSRYSERC